MRGGGTWERCEAELSISDFAFVCRGVYDLNILMEYLLKPLLFTNLLYEQNVGRNWGLLSLLCVPSGEESQCVQPGVCSPSTCGRWGQQC